MAAWWSKAVLCEVFDSIRADAVRVAVLSTCHNRRARTVACLEALFGQEVRERLTLQVFLVDDGCTDGTPGTIHRQFPQVRLITGDGGLYWCGGMRLAFETALAEPERFDYFLWLNDDTLLFPDALARLLATYHNLVTRGRARSIVVGSAIDPRTNKLSYGGLRQLWPLPFLRLIQPTTHLIRCTTMNGNCVLIPDAVARTVGNLDPALVHLRGDIDYGLRANNLGCEVWLAPGMYATCETNPIGDWRNLRLTLRQRLAALQEPKYALVEKNLVARRHYGLLWFLSPLALYAYIFLSHPISLFLRTSPKK